MSNIEIMDGDIWIELAGETAFLSSVLLQRAKIGCFKFFLVL